MNIRQTICVAFVAAFLCGIAVAADESSYRVGVAKVEITPTYPIRLNGFGFRREESEGVAQPIWAKALAISAGEEPPAVLIAIDSLGVRLPMVDEVAKRLQEKFGVPRDRVALTFSHSHCTPKVNGSSDNIFSQPIPAAHQAHIDQYTRELTDRLEQAAVAAIQDRRPAHLAWGVGKVGFAKNRRTAGGPVDHDLPLLVVRDTSGKLRAVYFNYACHCVTLSFNRISGDWSGCAQELIERQHPDVIALASIGCGSDSNPKSDVTGDKVEVAMAQGGEIAAEITRLLAGPLHPVTGPLSTQLKLIDLPLSELPSREQWREMASKTGAAAYNAQTQLARLERGEKLLETIHYPVQSFTFGDSLQMVFLAGEVCVDYSLRLKRELRQDRLWTNGYSNDFCAYIPSERLLIEGGYGGGGEIPYFALPATFKPGLERKIVDEVHRQTPAVFRVQPGTQGIPAKSPQESLQTLKTHDDLRIELVASEPLVASPVAIDFGADGRLWVAEMTDYSRGVNDEFKPRGRIRVLADLDGDGQYDRSTEFLDGLRFPTDVKVWRDGVLVCDAPEILYAEDTNSDGRADVRKVLFAGFATHNPHARVNSLRYGLDNWVYGSGGLFGGRITSFNGQTIDVTNRDFRMNPNTGVIEPVTGQTQQGRPNDDWSNWFGCTNGTLLMHHVIDDHYIRRNPHVAPPAASRYVPDYPDSQRLFPRGDLVLFQLSGPPGRPTSACGAEIYRDDWLGKEYYGNSFVCEPVNQLVHRLVLSRNGVSFSGQRAPQENDTEFLTSTDRWFRPVQVRTGPDGALWIVDMYRYVIEHPQWIPPEAVGELNVLAGQDRGRIYRIVPKERGIRPTKPLNDATDVQLIESINHPNGVRRDLGQQLLTWRHSAAPVAERDAAALERIARESPSAASRLQALSTLDGLKRLTFPMVARALTDSHPEVRRHAVRLSEQFARQPGEVLPALLVLVGDKEAIVRLQLAYTLGGFSGEKAAGGLADLAVQAGDDPYLAAAVISSVNAQNTNAILKALAAKGDTQAQNPLMDTLLSMAAATGDEAAVVAALAQAADSSKRDSVWRWKTLAHVLDAADRRRMKFSNALGDSVRAAIQREFKSAEKVVASADAPESSRLAAIELMGRAIGSATRSAAGEGKDADLELLSGLLNPNQSPSVQSAAVLGISRRASADAPKWLLSQWELATVRLRGEMLDALLPRDNGAAAVLQALEEGTITQHDLDAARRQRLLASENADLRKRAEKVFATSTTSDRQTLVAQWRPVTTLRGDKVRGQETFRLRCSACHQLKGIGTNVGPDLAALTNKTQSSLLVAILDPNRDVEGRYVGYVAQLADGRALTGLLANESGTSVTLREQGGKDHVILRKDLEVLRATGKSVMPEGLEKDMSQQDVADAMAYVLGSVAPPKRFAGNTPETIKPDARGALELPAAKAEIFGGEIAFETDSAFKNIGYWHGVDDFAGWQVELEKPGCYDVNFDYSCAPDAAGNGFRFEGGEPILRGAVVSTGGWDSYRLSRVGRIELPAGRSYLTVRFDGEKKASALLDLRGVHLALSAPARSGATTTSTPAKADEMALDPVTLARMLLDDTQPAEARQKLLASPVRRSEAVITALAQDLTPGTPEEYRRIPWIWRVAIAAGKRNETAELRLVLESSLPGGGQPLRDWQAVVIGGGIINGVSQKGEWPKQRIMDALKVDGVLVARWQRTVELASAMVDDEKVPAGTRYDALRIVAMASWDQRGEQLLKYLGKNVHEELQMGAVSGIVDVPSPRATEALIGALSHLSGRNRDLALDGLLRSPDRCLAVLDAVAAGQVSAESLGAARRSKLVEHPDEKVRQRASQVLGK